MAANDVTEPAVQALIAAINAGDRQAFFAALTPDATMSDDGTDRDLAGWAEREIFTVHGHLDVVSARDGGRSLIAAYRNDTWGEMRTSWAFTIAGGKISRFETGSKDRGSPDPYEGAAIRDDAIPAKRRRPWQASSV
jgi:hypothetical protein